jgi:Flp pilus assembly protein TadG
MTRSIGERGQVTAFVVVMTTALIFMAGLVLDGGYVLAAKRRAINEAERAARAGAQSLSEDDLRSSGAQRLDPDKARRAAQDYLARTGHQGQVVSVSGDTITVRVQINRDLLILPGGSMTVSGTASARNVRGVVSAET